MKNLINILKFAVFGFCCSSCADLDIPSDGRVSLNEILIDMSVRLPITQIV